MPFTLLLQKFDFHLDEQFCKEDFAKVFIFNKLLRKANLDPNSQFHDSIILSSSKMATLYKPKIQDPSSVSSQIDIELEALRNEVLNCEASSLAEEQTDTQINKHSIKVCSVGTSFKMILKVSENFGVDLNSAKDHPNKELQEDLRSLSRSMMQDSESEVNLCEEGKIQDMESIHQIQPQIGQLSRKNSDTFQLEDKFLNNALNQEANSVLTQNNNGQRHLSRNMKQKQHQSFLQKAVNNDLPGLTKVTQEDEETRYRKIQQNSEQQRNVEKIFKRAFQQIVQGLRFYAWPCFRIPSANNLIPLMNTSFLFNQMSFLEEKRDCDFLIALSMMSGRKFLQAVEQFRKLQNEILLQDNLNQQAFERCIQFEILIADSMNQHSQLSEKINAFQRAVDFSLKIKPKSNLSQSHHFHQIREEESYKLLMMMHPYLIKLLLQNLDSKIEAIKVAVLRNIEFLIDQLGCSLDQHLTQILIGVIHTYPRSNLHFSTQVIQNQKLPLRYGFYQLSYLSQNVQGNNPQGFYNIQQQQSNFDQAIQNSYLDSILYDQNQESDISIKDGINFQQTYQTSIKNLHNHILESFISLLSSMSSQVLQQIFHEILQKCIFLGNNPLENQLATDLRIYLLKLTDKIINICQGDLILNLNFINNIAQTIIPDQRKLQNAILGNAYNQAITLQNQMEIVKAKQKTSETISLACHNLWQTCRLKLFCNYSTKGFKILLEWTFNNLISLAENSESLTQDEQQKLSMVFDVIDLITQQQSFQEEQQKQRENSSDALEEQLRRQAETNNHQIQSLSGRETRINTSRLGEQTNLLNGNDPNQSMRQPLIRIRHKSLSSLELYALINPVLFWLDFSLEKLDRLSLFKMIWKTLNKILQVLPAKYIDIDTVQVIIPVLQKVNLFCQSSSPQLEMLQFLQVIFQDFVTQKKRTKELHKFLDLFLITIAKCIPHNLHEEVFVVCEQILEIMKYNLKDQHIMGVIDALTDKYTMRSKAHKKLQQYFIEMILTISSKKIINGQQIETNQNSVHVSQQQEVIRQSAQVIRQSQTSNTYGVHQHQQHLNPDHIDNYDYDRDSNEYVDEDDEQSEEQILPINQINQHRDHQLSNHQLLHQTNQDYNESPLSQRIFHSQSNFHQNSMSAMNDNRTNQNLRITLLSKTTYFDSLIEVCLVKNVYEYQQKDRYQEQINLELYFEKLTILQQTLRLMISHHIQLFNEFLKQSEFKESMLRLIKNERSPLIAIDILDLLSSFYMTNCAPKNIYEHAVNLLQGLNIPTNNDQYLQRPNNNNQTSQSSGGQQQNHHYNRESSRASFISNTQNNNGPNFNLNLRNQLSNSMQQNPIQFVTQSSSVPIQQIQRFQQNHTDDDLLIDHLNDDIIQDELDIINKERLILIQVHALFVKQCIHQYDQTHDAYIQFHTLNMLDNLFTNLMPVPNYQNLMIKQNLQRHRNQFNVINGESAGVQRQQHNPQIKIHHYEIPDLEKFQIIDNHQTYQQLVLQQQHVPSQIQQSFVFQEFECIDNKFLHARLNFAFKIWNFIEQSLLQSSWSNIKSICYGVICQILKIDIQEYKQSYQNKVKQVLFPLLNTLLFSKESESKAGGLNILGSFCGLGHDFTLVHHFQINLNLQYFRRNSNFISLALWQQVFNLQEDWDPTIREAATVLIQICAPRESIKHFNSIIKEKYQLKMQSLIKTYNAAANQNIRQKLYSGFQYNSTQMPSIMINQSESVEEFKIGSEVNEGITEKNSQIEERKSIFRNYLQTTQSMRSGFGSQLGINQLDRINAEDDQNSSSSEDRLGNFQLQNDSSDEDYFYVDTYNEDQIKQLIAIFKNDYKPPKNLWIEKNGIPNTFNANVLGSEYIDLNAQGNDGQNQNNIMDIFEDKIVDRLNNINLLQKSGDSSSISNVLDNYFQKQNDTDGSKNASGESEYLIFERHFESDKEKLTQPSNLLNDPKKDTNRNNDPNQNIEEDLGIIDLDEDDGGDEFDELDDDKLPVLKNTYSKKNRPNNSKSVAVGSRTQEMKRSTSQHKDNQKFAVHEQEEQKVVNETNLITNHCYKQQKGLNFDSDEDEVLIIDHEQEQNTLDPIDQNLIDDVLSDQDQKIDEYEQKIARTIQDLNDQLQQTKDLSSPKQKVVIHEDIIIKSPQIQITATIKVNKRNEELSLMKNKPKTNKSFDLKHKKTGLQSPLRMKEYQSTNISQNHDLDGGMNYVAHSQKPMLIGPTATLISTQNTQVIKKINDPLMSSNKKTYSSQAQRLKNQVNSSQLKKDLQTFSKPQLLSTTQPSLINQFHLNPQSAKQSTQAANTSKNSISQFGAFTATNSNARNRKSEYHRKSDVPPYSTLAQKKFATSSLSQNTNQTLNTLNEKSTEKLTHLSQSQVNNHNLDTSLSQSKNLKVPQVQSLMQKAKQAFVSRAKSQSYLNSFMAMGNYNSVGSSMNSLNLQKKADNNSFKQQSSTYALNSFGITNKSLTVSLEGGKIKNDPKDSGKRRIVEITQEDQQYNSIMNSACSGGMISQIHKGYFSNDECERVYSQNNDNQDDDINRKLLSPPGSGELQKRAKNSFSQDDEGKIKGRPSSHHLKSRMSKNLDQIEEVKTSQINLLLDQDLDEYQELLEEKNKVQRVKKTKRYVKKD